MSVHERIAAGLFLALALAGPLSRDGPALVWRDAETGKILFSVDDILRFDWERQRLEITRQRAMDLLAIDMGLSRRFSVEDEQGVIYRGTLVSEFSSMSHHGPLIMLGPQSRGPVYDIRFNRPATGRGDNDERFAPRLRAALERAHVLARIDDPSETRPIEFKLGHEWLVLTRGLRALATIFPDTFRSGSQARVHVTLLTDEGFEPAFDHVKVEMLVLSQNGGSLPAREILSIQSRSVPKAGFQNRQTHVCKPDLEQLRTDTHGIARIAFRYTLSGGSLESP